jgi:hypothetical protein
MKTFYAFILCLLAATSLHAQKQEIPAVSTATNLEKNGAFASSSNVGDSLFGSIKILPNLAAGKIILLVSDENVNVIQQGECVIFNSGGAPVARASFTTGTNQIYINNMPSGMYFLKLMQKNGQVATKKFVVMR